MNESILIIKVPNRIVRNNLTEVIRKLSCFYLYKNKRRDNFYINFSDVEDIDLVGLLVFYKFLEYSVMNNCFRNPYLLDFDNNIHVVKKIKYFGFIDLISSLKKEDLSDKQYKNLQVQFENDFIIAPLPMIKGAISSENLNDKYSRQIKRYYTDEKTHTMIFSVFSELYLNFLAHASGDDKSIIVAHGNKNYVEIVCADSGIGIVNSVTSVLPNCKREMAIQKAVMKGFTSKLNTNHMGYGLWLVNEITTRANGKFLIISNEYAYENNSGKIKTFKSPIWNGTIAYVKLFLKRSITIDDIEYNNSELNNLKVNFQ